MNKSQAYITTLPTKVSIPKFKISDNLLPAVAAAEFLIILFLIFKLTKKNFVKENSSSAKDLILNAKGDSINMNDLMNNINKSKELYKKLNSKCHPDRFLDSQQNHLANSFFQEITKNQRNYQRLLELKEQVQKELNVTI